MHLQDLLVGQTALETPPEDEGLDDEQRELLAQLEQYVQARRGAGERVERLEISTGTWQALGKPSIAAGVRVTPAGAQTTLPE